MKYSYGPPHMAVQKQDDQLELTYSNYVRTQDVTLKTSQTGWMIGRSGERGSGISVLAARDDDDDDINLRRLFNAKPILLEDQWRYYSTRSWEDKEVHTFPKGICPKVNVIARLEFESAYYDSAVHHFNHYTTKTPPIRLSKQLKHQVTIFNA